MFFFIPGNLKLAGNVMCLIRVPKDLSNAITTFVKVISSYTSKVNIPLVRRCSEEVLFRRNLKHILFVTLENFLIKISRGCIEDV